MKKLALMIAAAGMFGFAGGAVATEHETANGISCVDAGPADSDSKNLG